MKAKKLADWRSARPGRLDNRRAALARGAFEAARRAMKPLGIAVGVWILMLSFAGAAEAAFFLQWGRALVPTTSEPRCMQIAADVARRSGPQNGAGNQSFGIVMVVADANDVAVSTRDRIKSIFETSGP